MAKREPSPGRAGVKFKTRQSALGAALTHSRRRILRMRAAPTVLPQPTQFAQPFRDWAYVWPFGPPALALLWSFNTGLCKILLIS